MEGGLAGTVAVVGFPNVGKSTLVNRLTGTRQAVVHETPGVTRDRKEVVCEWNGKRFLLVDTGGVDIVDPSPITRSIADQARAAIAEADLILFVVDARAGVMPGDEELAAILRTSNKPVLLLANKIDDPSQDALSYEFHRLGLGDPLPISAAPRPRHRGPPGRVVSRLPGAAREEAGEDAIRVAILGRPNVGKSSLLNAILGEERVIVSETPGTTRDAIDTVFRRGERTFVLVDTAGLRRHRRQRQGIEYYSELRALQAAERADVALVVIDVEEGVVDQDLAVADVARRAHNATLVVLNKWDIGTVGIEDVRPRLEARLRQRPPIVAASAKTGRGIGRMLDRIEELFDRSSSRITTAELNKFLGELKEARQPPARSGKRLNMLYGTQIQTRPPRFRVVVNDPGADDPRLRLLGREPAPGALRPRGRPGRDRLRARANESHRHRRRLVGTAFARLLADRGHEVALAVRDPEQARAIAETGRNQRYLPDVDVSDVTAVALPEIPDADVLVMAVPSHAFGEVAAGSPGGHAGAQPGQGARPGHGPTLSTLLTGHRAAVLSGPNFAAEIAAGLPGAAVIASEDEELATWLQHEINSQIFRVYVNSDLIGVELCAAAKNVIALAAGGVDGLEAGDNAKAALITRGLAEMARLAAACGARPETFAGLAGMGDLIVTCWSRLGRNRRAGELIARGATAEEAAAEIGQVVEGLTTAPVLRDLAHRLEIELPITEGVCQVLNGVDLLELASALMGRRPREE